MPVARKPPRSTRVHHGRKCWIIITVFVSVWGFFLVWSHHDVANLEYMRNGPAQYLLEPLVGKDQFASMLAWRRVEDANPKIAQQKILNPNRKTNNPWYGWQPQIASKMECPWETCLSPEIGCKTCRDEDLGPAPPVDPDWIPDATMLHQMYLEGKDAQGNPWPPPIGGDICEDFWGVGKDINKRLFQAVPVSVSAATERQNEGPRVFCGVYTMASAHSQSIRAMRETWAPRCDGFVAFSTESDPRIPAYGIHHEGKEEYNNMWQKSRAIWKFIGDHYLQDYDYFFLGGDDLFVIVDNLRAYLGSLSPGPDADHFVGRRFKGYGKDNYFNSGGAGYVLSRGTLQKYVTQGYENDSCAAHDHTSMEDVMMAKCLRVVFGIGLTDTRDSQRRERFHPFAPGTHLTWEPPEVGKHDWYQDYNKEWGVGLGANCCAPDSVSFHYIKKAATVRHLHSLLYECNGSAGNAS